MYQLLLLVAGIGAIVIGIRDFIRAKDSSDRTLAVVTIGFAVVCLTLALVVLPWLLRP